VRCAGAGYLVYLGARMLMSKDSPLAADSLPKPEALTRIFCQGVITNVLNPKVAMFFLAFLPQFVNPKGVVVLQIAALGLIFNTGGTLVNLAVALAAGRMGDRLRRSTRAARIQRWFAGTVFVGLGARLAIARN
ncbi:MAG TPA: LysE family translocator, partial [Terriglobales bacterium]|nr:LysE family translocator [Terriglobales bacterium]